MKTKKIITTATILLVLFVLAAPAAARTVGEIFTDLTGQSEAVGSFIVIAAAVGGLVSIIAGFLQIKRAGRQGHGAGSGWGAVIIGVCLVCLVVFSGSLSETIFGDEESMSDHIEGFQ
jgi:hypothetical protein